MGRGNDGGSWSALGKSDLRRRAEHVAAQQAPEPAAREVDVTMALHELRVHEIELSMQNDELRRNHVALLATRNAYHDLYDHAPVGYVTLDARTTIVGRNRTAAALLGLDDTASSPGRLAALLGRDDADRLYLHLRAAEESGALVHCEVTALPAGRPPVRLRLDTVAVKVAERPAVFRTTLVDVSERHALEQQLREANLELEARVAARGEQLRVAHERLSQVRTMEAIGRLAGGVAHDFNNLLTVIRLQAAKLRRQLKAEGGSRAGVDEIEQAARRGAALTGKLLAFARRDTTRTAPYDAAALLEELRPMLGGLAGERADLVLTIDGEAGAVELERTGLEQVLINLVANSRDAIADHGRIEVRVAGEELDDEQASRLRDGRPGRYVTIAVRDDGAGMAPETLARAFEPFFTTKERGRGTGFGLATVYSIVAQAGGFLDARSEPGAGTTVTVYLPVARAGAAPPVLAPVTAMPQGGTDAVLVVDDEPMVRAATSSILAEAGYHVVSAASGSQALAVLHGVEVDLIVSDVVMPGMSGTELADHVAVSHPGLPVILVSGHTFDLPAGPYRFLGKPYDDVQLLAVVREVLDAAPARRAPS